MCERFDMPHDTDSKETRARIQEHLAEIFNTVARHLLTQARRAVCHSSDGLRCAYRMIDGRACAVGCLIRPEHYHEGIERLNVIDARVTSVLAVSLGRSLSARECSLLVALQNVHDLDLATWGDDSDIPAWSIIGKLNRVALQFDLPPLPKPDNAPAGV